MIAFIEDQRFIYGIEAFRRVLPIAPSIARQAIRCIDEGTYYHRLARLKRLLADAMLDDVVLKDLLGKS